MKDVRIVIVSWNVEKLLERCLRSLPNACDGIDWEAVVVDNGSTDKSAEIASLIATAEPRIHLIRNSDNRGFARACNQGIAGSEAEFVLLLNPDTESPQFAITRLLILARQRPRAGIVGPRILYPDCRYQESVRRFPDVWSQAGILLKLHHVFPSFLCFKRYFAQDIDPLLEQQVDQVMGATFLIRREVIQELGGLDERYFIWFEEVDYCRQAKELGWEVLYAPQVPFVHHHGHSFGQVLSYRKQQMFNRSLLKYFAKWHPGWRYKLLKSLTVISSAMAWFVEIRRRPERQWVYWLCGLFVFEIVSFSVVFWPSLRAMATVAAGLIMLAVTRNRPHLGLVVIFLELAVGSKGSLLKIPWGWDHDGGISLRMALMASFLMGWLGNAISYWISRKQEFISLLPKLLQERKSWFAVGLLVVWGIVRGIWNGNPTIMQDANAWLFLILLIPVMGVSWRFQKCLMRHAGQAAIAAVVWLPLKTVGALYVFSHGLKNYSQPLYLWIRRTGVGEVTLVTGNLFRIFIQSQVYGLAAFLFGSAWFADGRDKDRSRVTWSIVAASSVSLLIGLSRSFWVGLFAGMLLLIFLIWRRYVALHLTFIEYIRGSILAGVKILSAVAVGFGIITATVRFPYPKVDMGSLKTLFGSRGSTTDAAAESRWNLLPVLIDKIKEAPILGSGFGATVTYQSRDPRILAKNPSGTYTTYVFEWGWLEHWIKFGILGIPVMAWLLLSLMLRIWRLHEPWWLRASFVSSLAALGTLHIFTPYLNHPLGFGFLLAAEGWIIASNKEKDSHKYAET